MAVPGGNGNDHRGGGDPPPQPWYNRTPEVVGASLLGLAAIGLLVLAISFFAGQFNEQTPAPVDFVEPTFTATETPTGPSATLTTGTITSTSPPQTTEINDPLPSESTTSGSETTSGTETTSSTSTTTSRTPPSSEAGEAEEPTTTRTTRRPRTNVTRTLNPYP